MTREDQQTASRQRQGPKASCVHSSLPRSEPKRNAKRDRAKDSRVGSWQSRGGGAGTRLREGGRKSPWALGLPQDGGQRQEMEAREKGEQQSPGRGPSKPKGQSIQPQVLLPFPMVPQDPRPTPRTTLISPFTRPRQAGPPLRATFKQRQTCLSPPPTLGLPLAFPSCPRPDFKKNLPEGKSFFWKLKTKYSIIPEY